MKPFFDDPHNGPAELFVSACQKAIVLVGLFALVGCGVGGFSLEKADVDRSLVTSSLASEQASPPEGIDADRATIRNAVSSADISQLAGREFGWANADTGARGVITRVVESRQGGRLCRSFTGSRENFDGVAMFQGQACLAGQGVWSLESFRAL